MKALDPTPRHCASAACSHTICRVPALLATRSLLVETELRRSPRVSFIAAAEIMEANTQVRLSARTSDISRHGCYMDMVNPLPTGVAVKIPIAQGQPTFSATPVHLYP